MCPANVSNGRLFVQVAAGHTQSQLPIPPSGRCFEWPTIRPGRGPIILTSAFNIRHAV